MKYYKIIEAPYLFELESEVNKNMEGGWLPTGGIAMWRLGLKDFYIQAMIKGRE